MTPIFDGSVWQLIKQSDALSMAILIILLFLSFICWTITIYKTLLLRFKQNQIKKAAFLIKNSHSLDDVLHISSKLADSLPGYFYIKSLNAFKSVIGSKINEKIILSDRRQSSLFSLVPQSFLNSFDPSSLSFELLKYHLFVLVF